MEIQGTLITATAPVINTVLDSVLVNTTSSVAVNGFHNHTLQWNATLVGNTTTSLVIQSSLNDTNWTNDYSVTAMATTSSLTFFSGRRGYIRALYSKTGSVNNATASLLLLSGN